MKIFLATVLAALMVPCSASAIWWPAEEGDDIEHNIPGYLGGLIPGGGDLIDLEDVLQGIRDGSIEADIEPCPLGGIICIRMDRHTLSISNTPSQDYVTDYSPIQGYAVEYLMCGGDGYWGDDGEWHEGSC